MAKPKEPGSKKSPAEARRGPLYRNSSLPPGAGSRSPSLGHLDSGQVSVLLLFLTASTAFLAFPALVVTRAGNAGWIAMILSSLLGYLALSGWLRWAEMAQDRPFVLALRGTAGRFLGNVAGLLVFAYLVSSSALLARVFSGGTVIGLLTEVPIEILQGSLIAITAFGAWLGLEPVARTALILAPVVTLSLVIVFLASTPLLDLRRVLPLFGLGLPAVIKQGFRGAGVFASIGMVTVLKAYMRKPSDARKTAFLGLSFGASFMLLTTLLVASVFPYPESTRQLFPLGVMSRSIILGKFLQRLEAVFSFSWFFFIAVHLAVSILLSVVVFSQLVNTQTVRPFIFPVSCLAFGLGLLPPSLIHAVALLDTVYTWGGNAVLWLGWILYFASHPQGNAGTSGPRGPESSTLGAPGSERAGPVEPSGATPEPSPEEGETSSEESSTADSGL